MKEGVREGTEQEARQVVATLMEKYHQTTGAEQRRILAAIGQSQYPSILTSVLNYTLDGTWRLGLRPFISESGQVLAKMANVSSITNNLITQNLNFCKNSVTKVKLNDIL